jgi:hypothetical protein
MGWGRGQISQCARLQDIDAPAWQLIATTVEAGRRNGDGEAVAGDATAVAHLFREFLLGHIVPLTADQQR